MDEYHQHLIYVDMKMKSQAQIDVVLNRAGLPPGGERFLLPAAKQSNMVGLHERTSRIATQQATVSLFLSNSISGTLTAKGQQVYSNGQIE